MYQPVKLIYKSHQPIKLEIGMMFAMSVTVNDYLYLHVHSLKALPRDEDLYLEENGFPVKPYLVKVVDSNPDTLPIFVAMPDEIGWMEQDGLLYPFEIEDMNYISSHDHGYLGMYIEGDTPLLEDGLVILCYIDQLITLDEEDQDDEILN